MKQPPALLRAGSRWRTALLLAGLGASAAWLSGCSALDVINGVTPRTGYSVSSGLAYGPGSRQRADVYLPDRRRSPAAPASAAAAGAPVVVFFYGGNWRTGERGDYRFVAAALAARGAVVVVPDYSLFPAVRWDGVLRDSAAALAWALQQSAGWGGDPQRVFVMGHSAGAYNAAMLALDPRWLQPHGVRPAQLAGLVGLAGPYNFLPIVNTDTQPVFNWPDTPADSQPLAHVGDGQAQGGVPPALLLAPERDRLVDPERNTERLAAALRAAGVPVQVRRHGSLSHVTILAAMAWPLRPLAPVLDEVAGFVLNPPPRSR